MNEELTKDDIVKLYCERCHLRVAKVIKGTTKKPGAVMLCENCWLILLGKSNHMDELMKQTDSAMPDFMKGLFR